MGKRLGHMIREFREKQGRTIEEAARGLLSAAELSRVENGTKEIEYLIMEALFETYGKSLDKLEIVVSNIGFWNCGTEYARLFCRKGQPMQKN